MSSKRIHLVAGIVLGGIFGVPQVAAQVFTPVVSFSVHDEPVDGLGDSFNASPFEGLIRKQVPRREDRAMQEFDLTSLAGAVIPNAALRGRVSVNNAFDNGPRTFDFVLYAGNGVADLTDFQIAGSVVGSGSYHPPNQTSFDYSFDVSGAVQALLSSGATFIGLRCEATSDPNFPNILSSTASELEIGAPWTGLGFALTGAQGLPTLIGTGTLAAGSMATLDIGNGLGGAPGVLILGFQGLLIPLLGGTLVPSPDALVNLALDPAGAASLPFAVPFGASGSNIFLQAWFFDPAGPQSFSATNGLKAFFP